MAAASTAVLQTSLSAAALALTPFTIVRTRGVFFARSDAAVTETYNVAMGYAVVTEQASAIGITAVPTPDTDRDSDSWFVYEEIANRLFVADATGMINDGMMIRFDSKAMRKVEDGQDLVGVAETTAISLGANVLIAGRFLIKLH